MPVCPVFAAGPGGKCGTGEQRLQGDQDRNRLPAAAAPATHIGALKCALIAYLCCDKLLPSPSEKPTGCRCEPMANSDRPTIIEKYANRRLYNTGTYTFVTLDELAAMVKRGKDFVVYDAKTGADVTRSVQAQIVFEQENSHGAR
jgi:hypothetical protein